MAKAKRPAKARRPAKAQRPPKDEELIMPPETWEVVAPVQYELLFAMEDGGMAGAIAWLEERGLKYEIRK